MKIAISLLATFVVASAKPRVSIIGGEEVEKYSIPYQLSLQYIGNLEYLPYCGGTLISSNRALTSAHCCDGVKPGEISVVGGEHSIANTEGYEQRINVEEIIMHENYEYVTITLHDNYDTDSRSNDICMLKLAEEFRFSEKIYQVSLPTPFQEFEGDAVVSGWGYRQYEGFYTDALQKVTVPIVSNDECEAHYPNKINDSMICAGEESKGFCRGDEGGPLTCGGILCGIVSWGDRCASNGRPGVYTKTSHFIDWIHKHMD